MTVLPVWGGHSISNVLLLIVSGSAEEGTAKYAKDTKLRTKEPPRPPKRRPPLLRKEGSCGICDLRFAIADFGDWGSTTRYGRWY